MSNFNGRPFPLHKHPVVLQSYMIPTPGIDALISLVRKCVRSRLPGAIVYGESRMGKTYAIRYARAQIQEEFGLISTFDFQCERHKNLSEDSFFTELLIAVGHKDPHSGKISKKRSRLIDYLMEKATSSRSRVIVLFADEAQRLQLYEYEWLRDVHDKLGSCGVKLITILVGQNDLLNQKHSLRQANQTQVVARFMVNELRYRGLTSIDDLATCLSGYDTSCFPEDSDWTFTRFYFPIAYAAGFRLLDQTQMLWNVFLEAQDRSGYRANIEIPMQYFSGTIEYIFTEYNEHDGPDFGVSAQMWKAAVDETSFVKALEEFGFMRALE